MQGENGISRGLKLIVLAGLVIAVVLLLLPRLAAGQDKAPAWFVIIEQKLARERTCLAPTIVQINEFPLGNQVRREGRVRCSDGREFEFTQATPHEPFTIRSCEPARC